MQPFKHKVLFRMDKEKNPSVEFIGCGSEFKLQMTTFDSDMERYKKWLELSFALFGIGGRSRRARGCFSFSSRYLSFNTQKNFISSLCQLLNQLSDHQNEFQVSNSTINRINDNYEYNYPYIKSIILGEKYNDWGKLLEKIDTVSHNQCSKYTGYAYDKQRYASPIFVFAHY